MNGVKDELVPNGSGNFANALEHIAGEGIDDDFLTGDDVTIAQIHSLACKLQHHEHCRSMFGTVYTFLLTFLSTDIYHSNLLIGFLSPLLRSLQTVGTNLYPASHYGT